MQLLKTFVIFNYQWCEIFSLSPQRQLVLVFLSMKMFHFRKLFLREQKQKPLKEIILLLKCHWGTNSSAEFRVANWCES